MKSSNGFMGLITGIALAYVGIELEKAVDRGAGTHSEKLLKKIGVWSCVLTTSSLINDIHSSGNFIRRINKAEEFNMQFKF